ncbi:MAG TPA: DUF552 domain-containing protein [Candidatus Korarchaeota archaeon]|nr:cell division protein SepF [Candidatus Korarchaeota archaeon]HDI74291.1 DUF552 domain-containing protein [Candidatus Korarchaeota archaeon]
MGFFRKLFGRGEEDYEEEYVEEGFDEEISYEDLDYEAEPVRTKVLSEKAITVKPMNLRNAEDVEQVLNEISEGNIILLRYDDLAAEGEEKLRFIVQRLKERVLEMGGDLVLIKDRGYPPILIVPRFVEIWRSPE